MDSRIMGTHSYKLPVPCRFYNPSDVFSKLGLSQLSGTTRLHYRYVTRYPGTGTGRCSWLGRHVIWYHIYVRHKLNLAFPVLIGCGCRKWWKWGQYWNSQTQQWLSNAKKAFPTLPEIYIGFCAEYIETSCCSLPCDVKKHLINFTVPWVSNSVAFLIALPYIIAHLLCPSWN